jgi:uncharacterized protein YdhG (YjbR/CyaY superfamily)
MQSQADDVDQYLQEVPAGREEALRKLRALCRETLAGYEESMAYGMPSYEKAGTVGVAFASQKNYISLYVLKQEVFDRHRPSLEGIRGISMGKGCIRYSKPERMDFELISQLLADAVASEAGIC